MQLGQVLIVAIVCFLLTVPASAEPRRTDTFGYPIVELMRKEDAEMEDVVREVERLRGESTCQFGAVVAGWVDGACANDSA
jgi:hypothetical protein